MSARSVRLFALAILAGVSVPLHGQSLKWLSHYGNGTTGYDNSGFRMATSAAGHLYCLGTFGAPALDMDGQVVSVADNEEIVLAKLDTSGQAIWAVAAGGDCGPGSQAAEGAWCIRFDEQAAHVIMSGLYSGDAAFGTYNIGGDCFGSNLFLSAYDTNGNCSWVFPVQAGLGSGVLDVMIDSASDIHWFLNYDQYAIFLDTGGNGPVFGGEGMLIAKFGSDGTLHGARRVMPRGIIAGTEWVGDDWLLAGNYKPGDSLFQTPLICQAPSAEGFLAFADTAGGLQWLTTVGSDDWATVGGIRRLPSGKIIALGAFTGHAYFPSDTLTGSTGMFSYFVAAYDPNGQFLWAVPVVGEDQIFLSDLAIGLDGNIYVQGASNTAFSVGSTTIDIDASAEMFVAKLDTMGDCIGAMRMGRVKPNNPGSMLINEMGLFVSFAYDSTMVVDGTVVPTSGTNANDLFVARFDSLSGFTGIERVAEGDQLHIYANPNNGLCTIDLPTALRATDDLVLSIYDNTGHLVQRAPLQFSAQGLKLDIRAQAKGIYHVVLGDGQQRYTGTIVFE